MLLIIYFNISVCFKISSEYFLVTLSCDRCLIVMPRHYLLLVLTRCYISSSLILILYELV